LAGAEQLYWIPVGDYRVIYGVRSFLFGMVDPLRLIHPTGSDR